MAETKTTQKTKVQQKPTIFITQNGLLTMLLNTKGATFVQIKTTTEPKMRVTDNPYRDNILKDTNSNVMIGFNYENIVNNSRVKDAIKEAESVGVDKETLDSLMAVFNTSVKDFTPNFEPKPHQWADHCKNPNTEEISRIIVEKRSDRTCKYVQVWILSTGNPVYRFKDTGKTLNPYEVEILKPFLQKSSSNKEHQGLKKEVFIRDYAIANIKQINMRKLEYHIS